MGKGMQRYWSRHQDSVPHGAALKAGLGALLAIGSFALLGESMGLPFLIAPFGASCVLLFYVPESPQSQPANTIGGYFLAGLISLLIVQLFPTNWWSVALAVGLTVTAMGMARITHPPAGALPVVILLARPGWEFLLMPTLLGSVGLVALATIIHRLPPHERNYPLPGRSERITEDDGTTL
jgi:CBS-domain-containing membrane protein